MTGKKLSKLEENHPETKPPKSVWKRSVTYYYRQLRFILSCFSNLSDMKFKKFLENIRTALGVTNRNHHRFRRFVEEIRAKNLEATQLYADLSQKFDSIHGKIYGAEFTCQLLTQNNLSLDKNMKAMVTSIYSIWSLEKIFIICLDDLLWITIDLTEEEDDIQEIMKNTDHLMSMCFFLEHLSQLDLYCIDWSAEQDAFASIWIK